MFWLKQQVVSCRAHKQHAMQVSSSDESVVLTEIDPESDEEACDADVMSISSGEEDPVKFWIRRCPRLEGICATIENEDGLSLQLPALSDDPHAHTCGIIKKMLAKGYLKSFKVAITHLPILRWRQHKESKYREMQITAIHDDSSVIAAVETSVIGVFRRYDSRGYLVNAMGHPLCDNRNPGGESAHHGVAPFTCYVLKQ